MSAGGAGTKMRLPSLTSYRPKDLGGGGALSCSRGAGAGFAAGFELSPAFPVSRSAGRGGAGADGAVPSAGARGPGESGGVRLRGTRGAAGARGSIRRGGNGLSALSHSLGPASSVATEPGEGIGPSDAGGGSGAFRPMPKSASAAMGGGNCGTLCGKGVGRTADGWSDAALAAGAGASLRSGPCRCSAGAAPAAVPIS